MATEIKVPTLGESISEATITTWLKQVGDTVAADEPLLELETDKVTMEVNAPAAGTLTEIIADAGADVEVGAVLGMIGDGGAAAAAAPKAAPAPAPAAASGGGGGGETVEVTVPQLGESIAEATVSNVMKAVGDTVATDEPILELETDKVTMEVNAPAAGTITEIVVSEGADVTVGTLLAKIGSGAGAAAPAPAAAASGGGDPATSPAVRKLLDENNLDASVVAGTGKDGRLTKGDVLAHLNSGGAAAPAVAPAASGDAVAQIPSKPVGPREERVKMTRLRQRIAQRLKDAQNTAAMLTTFNEIDMSAVMEVRNKYRDTFEKAHGVRLGFMSFFVKACIVALKEIPAVNAEIDGDELVYKNHYDVGVAVGTPQGLVVPVLRDADQMSFADVEKSIREMGTRARDGKLSLDEMTGGTFTITNGGIYGSMLSTPILNAPQSGILGMHNIVERPVAENGEVVIRPMMYVAHSYDHRIIDGREAVTFLVRVKECIEDPQRIMLDM
ncbi:MAG: 2-oxoglutarate dehydrogenase complex dihydrolipoyllysine-residue succinyltransferase [Rhodospirillaceae bacterium]